MKIFLFTLLLFSSIYAFNDTNASCCKNEITQQSAEIILNNPKLVSRFYQNNQYKLHWDERDLKDFIRASEDTIMNYLGLDYHQDEINHLMSSINDYDKTIQRSVRARIELLATDGSFSFAKDLSVGFIDFKNFQELLKSQEYDVVWEKDNKIYNYQKDLILALKTNMIEILFQKYLPISKDYKKLVEAYHRFTTIEFPKVDYGKLMKEGDYGYRATQLKAYLVQTGDLRDVDENYLEFPTFDIRLKNALKRFQKRHYLKETGELDRVSVLYTRKSLEEKIELIKLNIERYKLLPDIYDKDYIVINIPEFSLKFFQKHTLVDDIFVVIGREDRPTPIFNDVLEYIVLNPSWNIPKSLVRKDYLDNLISKPSSLEEEGIFIHTSPSRYSTKIDPTQMSWEKYLDENINIPYYFMQYPGEQNVLGKMKFIFPNKYTVYLHDTNAKSLTDKKYRLYSSGCIRLSKPYEFLNLLSSYTTYSYEQLLDLIEGGKTKNVSLKIRIPIHIRYFTVFTNEYGDVSFRKDFYGLDALQLKSMVIP